jgi:beta-lactamase regulating signal transducer with metallopeptidase domain
MGTDMNLLIVNVSNHLQNVDLAAQLLDTLLKSLVVLTLAGGVCALWRQASAATRHLIWFLAVTSLLCLPILNLPRSIWQRPLWMISTGSRSGNQISLALELTPKPIGQQSPAAPVTGEISSANQNFPGSGRKIAAHFNANWMVFGVAAWLTGAALVLISMAVGQFRLRQLSRNARTLRDAHWTQILAGACEIMGLRRAVTLLESVDDVMPMTWGWVHPVVLLPAEAARWPVERRRIVLLHELAHVKRWDCLTQLAANVVCAIYWFNPLVWLAMRQMRVERELACDDRVLAGGCKASDYAGHLVDIAGSFRHVRLASAIAMARSSQLEARIAAIVDASRNRRLRWASAIAVLVLIGGVAVCIGGSGSNAVGSADKSSSLRQQQIERLKVFSTEEEKQSQMLAAAAGETISPEYQRFFAAATTGDWQTVTNMFENFKQRHPQYSHSHQHADVSLRTSYWQPLLDICLGYETVVSCEPEYTRMAADDIIASIPAGSIFFGGTDPGRGLPTAFCKSHVNADPFYTLTQNALADGTYLEYLQKTYGAQKELLGQLAKACQADPQLQTVNAEWPAAVQQLEALDINRDDPRWNDAEKAVGDLWQRRNDRVESLLTNLQADANAQTISKTQQAGPRTIYIPTSEDLQRCFQDYLQDAQQRMEQGRLKPGEDVRRVNGSIQVSGQVAVMAINGLLVKVIFDKNPGREFYLEESFPLDWTYPYLEPHGLIFKLDHQPLTELSDAAVRQDREYWQPCMAQMIGGWLNGDTPVRDVAAFAEKVFLRHDLDGFTGDPRYVQNDWAPKMFSKFRSAIAGLYAWRAQHATDASEKQRMNDAADFAFRQAWALCPYSPETAYRYVNLLTSENRISDALLIAETTAEMPAMQGRDGDQIRSLVKQLQQKQSAK